MRKLSIFSLFLVTGILVTSTAFAAQRIVLCEEAYSEG